MSNRREISVWNLQVPKLLDEAIEKAIEMDFHMTKSEYIRDAVREKLLKQGIKAENVKETTKE